MQTEFSILVLNNLPIAARLELLKQLTTRRLERESLYQNSSLWTVPNLSTTLDAMVGCHPKPLNTSNTMVVLIPKKHILTLEKMVYANSHLKMLVSKSATLSTLPW